MLEHDGCPPRSYGLQVDEHTSTGGPGTEGREGSRRLQQQHSSGGEGGGTPPPNSLLTTLRDTHYTVTQNA